MEYSAHLTHVRTSVSALRLALSRRQDDPQAIVAAGLPFEATADHVELASLVRSEKVFRAGYIRYILKESVNYLEPKFKHNMIEVRLRELASVARSSQYAVSRNLPPFSYLMPVFKLPYPSVDGS